MPRVVEAGHVWVNEDSNTVFDTWLCIWKVAGQKRKSDLTWFDRKNVPSGVLLVDSASVLVLTCSDQLFHSFPSFSSPTPRATTATNFLLVPWGALHTNCSYVQRCHLDWADNQSLNLKTSQNFTELHRTHATKLHNYKNDTVHSWVWNPVEPCWTALNDNGRWCIEGLPQKDAWKSLELVVDSSEHLPLFGPGQAAAVTATASLINILVVAICRETCETPWDLKFKVWTCVNTVLHMKLTFPSKLIRLRNWFLDGCKCQLSLSWNFLICVIFHDIPKKHCWVCFASDWFSVYWPHGPGYKVDVEITPGTHNTEDQAESAAVADLRSRSCFPWFVEPFAPFCRFFATVDALFVFRCCRWTNSTPAALDLGLGWCWRRQSWPAEGTWRNNQPHC